MKNRQIFYFLLIFLLLCNPFNAKSQQSLIQVDGWNAYVYLPSDYNQTTKNYPTIIFVPGTGEVGSNAGLVIANGPGAYIQQGWDGTALGVKFIIISLQPPSVWPGAASVKSRVDQLRAKYRIGDLFMTGLSMGGWVSMTYATTYPSELKKIVSVEGADIGYGQNLSQLWSGFTLAGGTMINFEQSQDYRVGDKAVAAMNSIRSGSAQYIVTNFGGGGHCCWSEFYGGGGKKPGVFNLGGINQNLYEWIARGLQGGGDTNQPPAAYAGPDATITLPQNSITLNGSGTDADGKVASFEWSKVSGPASFNIVSANSESTLVNGLVEGVYQFQLKVTDDKGAFATSIVNITVNPVPNKAPTANAGSDATITLPVNTVTLKGSGTDPDGTIASYEWTKVSGPSAFTIVSPNSATTDVNGLVAGVYQFQLKVTDDKGASATANVNITVNAAANVPPTANAGSDATITLPVNTVTLKGSGTDPDGTIASYAWTKVSGPSAFTIVSPNSATTDVNGLVAGVYQFQLKVTDDKGASATATVNITVNNAIATPPIVDAGTNQTIQLPQSTTQLKGTATDANGSIKQYIWTQISGPGFATIQSPDNAITDITNLQAGDYRFKLKVINDAGLSDSATVTVSVYGAKGGSDDCGCDVVLPKLSYGGIYFINGQNGITIKPGDKVCIKAGFYSNIYLRGIVGTPEKPITIINCGGLVQVGDSPSWAISIANCRYFRLTGSGDPNIKYGLKVHWEGGWTSTGIGVGDSCTDYEIDHYEAHNVSNGFICKINPTDCEPGTWGQNWTIKNVSLHDNYVHGTVGEAFYIIHHAATWDVKDCSTGQTITVEPVRAQNIKIYNNIIDSAGWDGIQLVGTIGAEIYNNRVTNFGLEKRDGQDYGIILGAKSTGKVYNNFVANGHGPGMSLTGYNNNMAFNNLIANVGGKGITVDDRPMPNNEYINMQIYLFNNTIVNADYDIRILNGYGTMAGGNKVYNNLLVAPRMDTFYGINPYLVIATGLDTDSSHNLYFQNVADAGFVNPDALDFRLLPNSPAINAGMNLSGYGVVNDLDGLSRPQGSSYDIGAYEYNENSPPPNQKPVANAGKDQEIRLPVNKVNLTGTGTDRDGKIVSYKWKLVSGPAGSVIVNADSANTEVNSLKNGYYTIELTVTDDKGDVGMDSVKITVYAANVPPTANAGADKVIKLPINTVFLSGSGTDVDGSIRSYRWDKISGPAQFDIQSPINAGTNVNNLVQGEYLFTLTVTDNDGVSAIDTVKVTVNAANLSPMANAGSDATITLPVNTVALQGSGSDADGSISSYKWNKISGPTQFVIESPSNAITNINNLIQGVYLFTLTVYDNEGAFGIDTVKVVVNAADNKTPVADAGPDRVITLPVNNTSLSGSGSDPDGSIVSYLWTKISGPAAYNIASKSSPATDISGLVVGVYEFQLMVTDDKGATATDIVKVTVNPAPNKPPVANAGPDRNITLPISTTSLAGSGSDEDGKIVSYQWTKISGPASYSIVNAASPVTDVAGLIAGVYEFRLIVTDDKGATASDIMKVTVNVAPNKPPVANAGTDKSITLPANTVTLIGSGSDEDGKIVSYQWTKVSGPAAYTIVNASSSTTDVSGLTAGVYEFQLKVTDDKGATGTDVLKVTVNAAPNKAPQANAGPDRTITLPVNTANLAGSGSDEDGKIISYQWLKVSGPVSYSIVNATSPVTDVTGLTEGVYEFQLKVTDDKGATATDLVKVFVNSVPNKAPVANAGPDKSIVLPANSVVISGSGHDDDGSIVKYFWVQVSGPSASTIVTPQNSTTEVNNLIAGTYLFELIVTDDKGALGRDTMQLTVQPQRESNLENSINVYPNPTPDKAVLELTGVKSTDRMVMMITDASGRMVEKRDINFTGISTIKTEIDLRKYSKGIYTVSLLVKGQIRASKKVIKIR